jgi:hypothetical protein
VHLCLKKARRGSLSILLDSSSALPADPRALCIVIPVAVAILEVLSRSRTRGGTWRGCGAHCGNRYDRELFSRIVAPLSRCSRPFVSTVHI